MVSILVFDGDGQPLAFVHRPMAHGLAEFAVGLAPGRYSVVALGIDDWRAQATFAVDAATATSQAPTRVELQPRH